MKACVPSLRSANRCSAGAEAGLQKRSVKNAPFFDLALKAYDYDHRFLQVHLLGQDVALDFVGPAADGTNARVAEEHGHVVLVGVTGAA